MADRSGIEWTDATWNPTTGCDRVSPGCDNCYALTLAKRLKGMGSPKYQVDGDPRTSGPGFGITEHPDSLTIPLTWRTPRKVFVNSMSDLFHDGVTDEHIARVFAVMALANRHTFQVLTKRHGRMRALLRSAYFFQAVSKVWADPPADWPLPRDWSIPRWPLPNVWLGVSVEDQKRADLRIPALCDTPAALRWLSCEPLLGPVRLGAYVRCRVCRTSHKFTPEPCDPHTPARFRALRMTTGGDIDWVVAGGESGPGARPMHPAWARSLRDQCAAAGVPFLFKQWGAWAPTELGGDSPRGYLSPEGEWSDTLPLVARLDLWSGMHRVGKGAAGRELDGRTWDEYPSWAREPRAADTAAGAPNQGPFCPNPDCHDRVHVDGTHHDEFGNPFRVNDAAGAPNQGGDS